MRCCDCKYYGEWQGYSDYGNECRKFGFEYFRNHYEEECPYITDDYCLTDEGIYLSEIL